MNHFIPKARGKLAIVDGRASDEILGNLKNLGLKIVKTRECKSVYPSISYHPDIIMHPLGGNRLMVCPEEYSYYKEILEEEGIELIKGKRGLKNFYPADIRYNVARIGNSVVHKLKEMDENLREELEGQGLEFINVKQGYSKCSLGLIGSRAGITSDRPIYNKLVEKGYDMLLIEAGGILLPGEEYGFIGGAMGNISEEEVLFTGSLKNHPDRDSIMNFIDRNNKKAIFLSEKEIIDLGSILIF